MVPTLLAFPRLSSQRFYAASVVLALGGLLSPARVVADGDIPSQAAAILAKRCSECHGQVNPQSNLSILDHDLLLRKYVTPNQPEKSDLFDRIVTTDEARRMPPDASLPAEEQAVLKKWIAEGAAVFPAATGHVRPFVSVEKVFDAIAKDLRELPDDQRSDTRYFTIHHLHNNASISERDLRTYRAALSKVANSLSWEAQIAVPVAIDESATVFRLRLSDLGWDRPGLWNKVLAAYPYGLSYANTGNSRLRSDFKFAVEATETSIPLLRGDWFVATATRPPLYHDLLDLPDGDDAALKLEKKLNVDVRRDFERNRLARAGFQKSNVSEFNRLVDRHPAAHGAYWKSYDFGSSAGKQNLLDNPLGPPFENHPFARYAFQHDGGELIFNLPNGLQAYLLVDSKGKRIDEGPINIVFDAKSPLGNRTVINGISCMVCHVHGMQPFKDEIRDHHAAQGDAVDKVQNLYPKHDAMNALLERDRQRFLSALDAAIGPFVRVGSDANRPLEKLDEPVGGIAKRFSKDLAFQDVMAEIGLQDPNVAKAQFSLAAFRKQGLGAVAEGKLIKREAWQHFSKTEPFSHYHQVAEGLSIGTPRRVFP